MDFGGGDEIRFERVGKAGVVTLTRPDALNALTHPMSWRSPARSQPGATILPSRSCVVKAEGRAFSRRRRHARHL